MMSRPARLASCNEIVPPQRVYYSYFERRHQDEAFEDEDNVVDEAKRLKHEADQETNMETKCRKYLQVGHDSNVRTRLLNACFFFFSVKLLYR